MAKGKSVNVPNKVLHSRVSYLYQAASYLAAQPQRSGTEHDPSEKSANSVKPEVLEKSSEASCQSASRRLISDLRVVSLKVQIRMSPSIKHSVCKSCDTMLIDGSTCINEIENRSKGGKKPWADVLKSKNRVINALDTRAQSSTSDIKSGLVFGALIVWDKSFIEALMKRSLVQISSLKIESEYPETESRTPNCQGSQLSGDDFGFRNWWKFFKYWPSPKPELAIMTLEQACRSEYQWSQYAILAKDRRIQRHLDYVQGLQVSSQATSNLRRVLESSNREQMSS
ncbi:hypothetical protein G7Y89_g11832 [Cudoniella acicularis]|uniref:Uncharacterized protein n=1 Tax=Cudoniella acicularis TaxID=354080 RepID=A0A8H4RCF2_9HELO|nr:hypothetical protein G7Y89_g11832 [Cudoniella acicularis]